VVAAHVTGRLATRLGQAIIAIVLAGNVVCPLPITVSVALALVGAVTIVGADVVAVLAALARVAAACVLHWQTHVTVVEAFIFDPAQLLALARVPVASTIEEAQVFSVTFDFARIRVTRVNRKFTALALLRLSKPPILCADARVLATAQISACVALVEVSVALVGFTHTALARLVFCTLVPQQATLAIKSPIEVVNAHVAEVLEVSALVFVATPPNTLLHAWGRIPQTGAITVVRPIAVVSAAVGLTALDRRADITPWDTRLLDT
jgi:hypothetical protein